MLFTAIGSDLGLSDPIFKKRLEEERIDPDKRLQEVGAMWIDNVWHGRAHSWEKMPWLIKTWKDISGGEPFCPTKTEGKTSKDSQILWLR